MVVVCGLGTVMRTIVSSATIYVKCPHKFLSYSTDAGFWGMKQSLPLALPYKNLTGECKESQVDWVVQGVTS